MAVNLVCPAGVNSVVGRSGSLYNADSNGVISVATGDIGPLINGGFTFLTMASRKVSFNSPLPSDLVSVKAAAAPANGTITIAAQPAQSRKLQVRIVDGGTHITAGTLTLVGFDQDGNAVTEVLSLITTVDVTLKSANAYSKLTSGTVAALAGGGSSTLGIGLSNDFGIPTLPGAPGLNLVCTKASKTTKVLGTSNVTVDDVAATATVDTVARTIAPTTAPAANGLVDFEFSYTYGIGA